MNNNWLSRQDYDNGAYTEFTHNALGQLARLRNYTMYGSQLLSDYLNLAHDGAGNLTNLEADIPAHAAYSGVTTYTYDTKSQLLDEYSTRFSGYQRAFNYDAAGNPTTFRGQTRNYNSNNQITGSGYAYDGNGNPTTYGGTTLTFDQENHLTAYGTLLTAGYRGDHLRAWKQVPEGEKTYFLYDGTLLLHEMDEDGAIIATNTWGGANGLALRNDTRGTTYYIFDPQGNVAHRLDEYGNVQSNDLYDAYGNLLDGGDSADPYGYNGQWGYYTDHETGLVLCTLRYFDPANGRWVTRDPIGYAGGINLYNYCLSNPVGFSDSTGEKRSVREMWGAFVRWFKKVHSNANIDVYKGKNPNEAAYKQFDALVNCINDNDGKVPNSNMTIYRKTIRVGKNLVINSATTIYSGVGMADAILVVFSGNGLSANNASVSERIKAGLSVAFGAGATISDVFAIDGTFRVVMSTGNQVLTAEDIYSKVEQTMKNLK